MKNTKFSTSVLSVPVTEDTAAFWNRNPRLLFGLADLQILSVQSWELALDARKAHSPQILLTYL